MSSATTKIPGAQPRARKGLRFPSFSVQIVLGLVLGVLLGWLALSMGPQSPGTDGSDPVPNGLTTTLDTIGSSFVTLLKAIVPPL
ncbi:MAG: dicarboxylate/amino acid:cation symporter, partial [Agromyces sp.]